MEKEVGSKTGASGKRRRRSVQHHHLGRRWNQSAPPGRWGPGRTAPGSPRAIPLGVQKASPAFRASSLWAGLLVDCQIMATVYGLEPVPFPGVYFLVRKLGFGHYKHFQVCGVSVYICF